MSTVQSQNLTTSYFAQKISSRGKKIRKFNGSTTTSKTLERKVKRRKKVKRRRKVRRKAKEEKVKQRRKEGKRRIGQNTRRKPDACDVIGMHYFSLC